MTCKNCYHYEVCLLGACVKGATGTCLNYKDKSRIVELPCKVGDTIYDIYECVANGNTHIRELKVKDINIRLDLRNRVWLIVCGYYFDCADFGKKVFLTRKEAEEALRKEREK